MTCLGEMDGLAARRMTLRTTFKTVRGKVTTLWVDVGLSALLFLVDANFLARWL